LVFSVLLLKKYLYCLARPCRKGGVFMAKATAAVCSAKECPPLWFIVLVVLVGLWFILADLKMVSTYGVNWWSAAILLVGIKLWVHCAECR
jgi:hypothetical protein